MKTPPPLHAIKDDDAVVMGRGTLTPKDDLDKGTVVEIVNAFVSGGIQIKGDEVLVSSDEKAELFKKACEAELVAKPDLVAKPSDPVELAPVFTLRKDLDKETAHSAENAFVSGGIPIRGDQFFASSDKEAALFKKAYKADVVRSDRAGEVLKPAVPDTDFPFPKVLDDETPP